MEIPTSVFMKIDTKTLSLDGLITIEEKQKYDQLRPTDITRLVLDVLDSEGMTVDIAHSILLHIHDLYEHYDMNNIEFTIGQSIFSDEGIIEEYKKLHQKESTKVKVKM